MFFFKFLLLLLLVLPGWSSNAQQTLPEADPELSKRIDFWVRIYSEYPTTQGLIHDAKYPEIVYEVLDFNDLHNQVAMSSKAREKSTKNRIKFKKDFYMNALLSIHKKTKSNISLNDVETRIAKLFDGIEEPNKFFNAAHSKRVRYQLGQKDRYLQGLFYSGRYLNAMEQIFKGYGVPIEITRLPFVESSFNLNARSKVGASGIWQFMRSTGKLYLKINDVVDERNDPLLATHAAAKLLRQNFEALGSWPLAITAYNHGRKGLMRASTKLGTLNLHEIIMNYRSRSFGFASSNFYAEFMAAYLVEKNAEKYFGKTDRDTLTNYEEIVLADFVSLTDLSTYSRIPLDELTELNPSFTDNVVKGKYLVPANFVLRIPATMREKFLIAYNSMPSSKKFSSQRQWVGKGF